MKAIHSTFGPDVGRVRHTPPSLRPSTAILVVTTERAVAAALSEWLGRRYPVMAPLTDPQLIVPATILVRPGLVITEISDASGALIKSLHRLASLDARVPLLAYTNTQPDVAREVCRSLGIEGLVHRSDSVKVLLQAIEGRLAGSSASDASHALSLMDVVRHDLAKNRGIRGHVVEWMLASQIKQKEIADLVGLCIKSVEYHSRRARSGAA